MSQTEPNTKKRKAPSKSIKERSWVWNHVTKITVKELQEVVIDGKKEMVEVSTLKAKCNYCAQLFACDTSGGGTSTYSKHILKVCKKYVPNDDFNQKVLAFSSSSGASDNKSLLMAKGWSQEESVEAIVEFIVIDEMPFSVVEKEGFRQMMSKVQPKLCVPSRRAIVREFFKMYDVIKNTLRTELHKYRVSLTTDTWTSVQNINYMVLTAHFIDDDWNMHKRILNFCPIPSHHGKEIGKLIEQCLVQWKIEKIMCILVDNASANKVAIEWLIGKMKKWPNCQLVLEGKYMHVTCLAHTLNLIVKDGLRRLDKSVAAIRNAIKFVKSSPHRPDYFKKCVESEKLATKSAVVMDVPTRWNSTYLMLDSGLKLKKAFDRMCDEEDNAYLSYFGEREVQLSDNEDDEEQLKGKHGKGKVGPPGEKDWDNAQLFISFLKIFYLVILKVSASKHPTSHTTFHDVIVVENEIQKLFLPEYLQNGDVEERTLIDMATSMKAKYNKYFGSINEMNQLFIVALVLDPRFKLRHFLHLCKKQLGYSQEDAEKKSNEIKDLMKQLCDEYAELAFGVSKKQKCTQDSIGQAISSEKQTLHMSNPQKDQSLIFGDMMDDWEKELEDIEDVVLKHELDRYLLDGLEKSTKNETFNILRWWKLKGRISYPTLALLAKDVLVIQVSTVASESAFSTGGRVIDPFRSSLTPKTVESLICLQNWIRSEDISVIEYEASEAELEFYEECEAEHRKEKESTSSSSVHKLQSTEITKKNKGCAGKEEIIKN